MGRSGLVLVILCSLIGGMTVTLDAGQAKTTAEKRNAAFERGMESYRQGDYQRPCKNGCR